MVIKNFYNKLIKDENKKLKEENIRLADILEAKIQEISVLNKTIEKYKDKECDYLELPNDIVVKKSKIYSVMCLYTNNEYNIIIDFEDDHKILNYNKDKKLMVADFEKIKNQLKVE